MTITTDYTIKSSHIWKVINWEPLSVQIEQLLQLQALLYEWNKKINLTRLVNGNDFWISQVLDSLWPVKNELKECATSKRVIDVGSGCGFPGLAIAIALPNSEVTLIDSVTKKNKSSASNRPFIRFGQKGQHSSYTCRASRARLLFKRKV